MPTPRSIKLHENKISLDLIIEVGRRQSQYLGVKITFCDGKGEREKKSTAESKHFFLLRFGRSS